MDVRQRLGKNLRRLRLEKGLGQEKFALEYGFDRTYISGIERGVRNVGIDNIEIIAKALNVEPSELMRPTSETARR